MNSVKLFVDDSQDFLSALSFVLPVDKGPYLFIADPSEGLKCLQEKNNKISVIFMDNWIPPMTGLEIFEQISDVCAERIMLTGMVDDAIVQAFHLGLIHRYLSKRDPNLIQAMLASMEVGQKNYFERYTREHSCENK